jgi:O-methyltransferase involved in polyketide biosynthesis
VSDPGESAAPEPGRPEAPAAIDTSVASPARMYDYYLGGTQNFAADRRAAQEIYTMIPELPEIARDNRAFLRRAVRTLADAGIRQFVDIGSGLPTQGSVHEIAQEADPASRVVYVDNDPLVLSHARALLVSTREGATDYLDVDLHDPGTILHQAAKTLDLDRPVAVMLLGVLIYIDDTAEAYAIVRQLLGPLPPGSFLAVAHSTSEVRGEATEEVVRQRNALVDPPMTLRSGAEITRFFDGLRLLEPGVVPCNRWRPDAAAVSEPEVDEFCGIARKP